MCMIITLGDGSPEDSHTHRANLGKTEISLTLSNKFEVPEENQSDLKSLLIRTKRMVVDVIRCQARGETLTQVLQIPASQHEVRYTLPQRFYICF